MVTRNELEVFLKIMILSRNFQIFLPKVLHFSFKSCTVVSQWGFQQQKYSVQSIFTQIPTVKAFEWIYLSSPLKGSLSRIVQKKAPHLKIYEFWVILAHPGAWFLE